MNNTIQNYTNTKADLESAKIRLQYLTDKKAEIYSKCFSIAVKYKDINVIGSNAERNAMQSYIEQITTPNPRTGMSLEDEIISQMQTIHNLEYYLKQIEQQLNTLKGIEFDLYREIVVNGLTITKAVESVAEKHDKGNQTVWRLYRKKIKRYL